ncbi:MAG: acetyl-CoA carboxylase biotin carboxylase subunit, partial [Bacteroidota bacterium]|nr:acetyl-CoA carboxylase biotin carboxylase subunit [Bacteroidota bacterium]
RRHQKIIEEVPSPFMDKALRKKMGEAAIKATKAINYEGLGTVEFLVDKNKDFYFMEMNTRIQVEHPITEEVIGHDLVMEQIKIAAGVPISGHDYYPQAYAMECRINAEDPFDNFRPSPGVIETLHKPGGYGVRIDSHIFSGYTIPPHYDSMIAKVIVRANSREEVIKKMERALSEFVIEGIKTTIPLHLKILKNPDFMKGNFTTKFMETFDF